MNEVLPGEGRKSFPFSFSSLFFLALLLALAAVPLDSAAQKADKDGLSRYDRLAEEASLLNKRGNFDQVISLLEPHKKEKKNDSALFYNELGIAYRNTGKLAEAAQAYREASARDPQNPVILNNLGYVHYLGKDYPLAVEQFEKALALAPRFKEARSNLALALYRLQRYEDALREIETVLRLDPKHEAAHKFRETIRKKMQEKK